MSKYTMAQIVTLTGIKAHTLRKWEMRYSFLDPERTDTNIRYYSDKQLKKLLNIVILTRNGYRISKIDKMSNSQIHETIFNSLIDNHEEDDISLLVISMLEMDEEKFDNILKAHVLRRGLLSTTVELIYPFLSRVGVLWGINKVMPAQEHLISSLIKKKMFSAIDLLPYPKKESPSIIMFLPEGEHHELGLLLAYYIARELGWRVFYLGQNVPNENIKAVCEVTNPKALMTMFITPNYQSLNTRIKQIFGGVNLPMFVSGNPELFDFNNISKHVSFLANPTDFVNSLKGMS